MNKIVALATYHREPNLISEDQPLVPLLENLGIRALTLDWETPVPNDVDVETVVLRSCWNSHFKPQEFLHWIDQLGASLWNPPHVVRWNQDKTYLLELQSKGISLPTTRVLPPGKIRDRAQWIASSGLDELVIKPTISASAFGTFRLRSASRPEDIHMALSAIPESSPLLLQEFVPQISWRAEVAFHFDYFYL